MLYASRPDEFYIKEMEQIPDVVMKLLSLIFEKSQEQNYEKNGIAPMLL